MTPLQETYRRSFPDFEKETGIKVDWELLNHFEVISKGQADMLSGRGDYDAVMMHGSSWAHARRRRDPPDRRSRDNPSSPIRRSTPPTSSSRPSRSLAFSGGKQYGFLNWNYNQVYWARGDLLSDPDEQAAFKAKYGYDLAPAKTLEQMRDIAEFFTRKKGEKLAGKPLESDFYGIVLEGIKGGTTFDVLWNNFVKNFGGDIVDADGKPTFDTPENVAGIKIWADLWKFSPPGTPSTRWSTCRPSWATASPRRRSRGATSCSASTSPASRPTRASSSMRRSGEGRQ